MSKTGNVATAGGFFVAISKTEKPKQAAQSGSAKKSAKNS